MNENHASLLTSPEWAQFIQGDLLPSFEHDVPLSGDMLEIGPGPGATTEWLRHKVSHLTALEIEAEAAAKLAATYAGTNVSIVTGDATAMEFADESFDLVGTFTMMHHVPTTALQDKVLAEALRVLRPGGVLFGSDSLASDSLHHFHAGDTYNPLEPAALLTRLQVLGYAKITVTVDWNLRFIARKASPEQQPG